MLFHDDREGWDAAGIFIAAMLALAPFAMSFTMAYVGEDPGGPRPPAVRGGDLVQFWAGGTILREGQGGAALYDRENFRQRLNEIPHPEGGLAYGPSYPPPVYQLFAILPFHDYLSAARALLWLLLIPAALGAALIVRASGLRGPAALEIFLLIWSSPAALLSLSAGQLAGLWMALLGVGIRLWCGGRSFAGGIALGLLCIKPTLGAPVALALLLAGQWRAFAGFVAGGAGVLLASIGLGGLDVWLAYLEMLLGSPELVDQVGFLFERQFTARAFFALSFGDGTLAIGAGALVGLGLCFWMRGRVAPRLARDPRSFAALSALLAACAFATPHLLDYDLVLVVALLVCAVHGLARGKPPWRGAGIALAAILYLAPVMYIPSRELKLSVGSLAFACFLIWCGIVFERIVPAEASAPPPHP